MDPSSLQPLPNVKKKKRSIWLIICGTKELATKYDKRVLVKTTIRESVFYAIFLVNICLLALLATSPSMFYFTKILTDLYLDTPVNGWKSFRFSSTTDDFWTFSETVLVDTLNWETFFKKNDSDIMHKLYQNHFVGKIRLRQVRVKEMPCPDQDSIFANCYPDYRKENEDRFFPERFETPSKDAWTYHSSEHINGFEYSGRLAEYSGGGSHLLLDKNQSKAFSQIKDLKEKKWIKRSTRAVFLEFVVYNGNVNLHCSLKLVWEFPKTGGVFTSWDIKTVNLFQNNLNTFIGVLNYICEITFIIFTIYYTLQELLELFLMGMKDYFLNFWTYVDVILIVMSFFLIGIHFHITNLKNEDNLKNINENAYAVDFEILAYWEVVYNNLLAVLVFLSWNKLFKYITFNRTMVQLSTTLSKSAISIAGFALMFFIMFFAFVQLGYLLFGALVFDYSTILITTLTLLRMVSGDFNYRQIEAVDPVLGPLYFIGYIAFLIIILLNLFLAIIGESYTNVKSEEASKRNKHGLIRFFKKGFDKSFSFGWGYLEGKVIRKSGKKKEIEKNSEKIKKEMVKITCAEIKKYLKSAEFSEVEIEMFLSRYELDNDNLLTQEKALELLSELQGRQIILDADDKYRIGKKRRDIFGNKNQPLTVNEIAVSHEEIETIEKKIEIYESILSNSLSTTEKLIERIKEFKRKEEAEIAEREKSIVTFPIESSETNVTASEDDIQINQTINESSIKSDENKDKELINK